MGRKCCAPGCTSNYDKETSYTTVFKFPTDVERKSLWIRKLHRENFQPSATAVLCIKHFEERFIIREDRVQRSDGTELVVPRKKITLTAEAYPSIFANVPSYLTETLPPKRKAPDERWKKVKLHDEQKFVQWCADDSITSFEDLTIKCADKLTEDWIHFIRGEFVLFIKLKETNCPKLIVCFKIYCDLKVEIYRDNTIVDITSFEWILGTLHKCDRWTKFENMLSTLTHYNENSLTFTEKLACVVEGLSNCINDDQCTENVHLKLKFIKQQIMLLGVKRLRYPSNLILWCSKLYFSYPSAYIMIRNTDVFTLPHPSYLRKLTYMCSPTYSCESHISFLKNKANSLDEHEKIVNILLDEIYINPSFSYKAGCLIGIAKNSNSAATTIQAFMITSFLSKYKDVVALFPVCNITAVILLEYVNRVLSMLHECGFTVLAVISDNNRINRNMFTTMCGGEMKPYISNPYHPDKKMFFLFDSVHLIKAFRNNWLKQASSEQVIYYPSPYDEKVLSATLKNLKDIYEMERNSVVKIAPKLSYKVFYPNSIEKQNVKYALNLFDQSNCVALDMYKDKLNNALDTKLFVDFVTKWWKIVNVKHPFKGKHISDDLSNPIKSVTDDSFIFLQTFSTWLQRWDKLSSMKADEKKDLGIAGKGGMLSKETLFASRLTTDSLIELVKYVFDSLGSSYILLGKFQTDSLEARFGQYRQMSGGNYNVSCTQVMEAENKLRILSLITLHSEQSGDFQLKDLNCTQSVHENQDLEIPNCFYGVYNSDDDVEITNDTMSALIYIAGYVAHKVSHKLKCSECIVILVRDKALSLDCPDDVYRYLLLTDRGQLKWPQELMIFITVNMFQIFQKLIRKSYENSFLKFPEPKNLIIQLATEKLELLGIDLSVKCNCDTELSYVIKQCLSVTANIFLNNYTKAKNDNTKCNKQFKRKLSVLANV